MIYGVGLISIFIPAGEIATIVASVLSCLGLSDVLDQILDNIADEMNAPNWDGDINDLIIDTITMYLVN